MEIKNFKINDIVTLNGDPVYVNYSMFMSHQMYDSNDSVQPYKLTREFLVKNNIVNRPNGDDWYDPDEYFLDYNDEVGTYKVFVKVYNDDTFDVTVTGFRTSFHGIVTDVHILQHAMSDCGLTEVLRIDK